MRVPDEWPPRLFRKEQALQNPAYRPTGDELSEIELQALIHHQRIDKAQRRVIERLGQAADGFKAHPLPKRHGAGV